MTTNEHYQNKLKVITAIPDDQIVYPHNIPVDVYIMEAEILYRSCQEDKEEMVSSGLDWELVEDLPSRIAALRDAQARWNTQRFKQKHDTKQQVKSTKMVYDLRNILSHNFRFAYRNNKPLARKVKSIGKGNTKENMIQDLNALLKLGKKHKSPLIAINFDMELLDKAQQIVEKKNEILNDSKTNNPGYKKAKKIRDQVYTHLKESVDKICTHGRFLYWRNKYKLKKYCSKYLARKRRKRNKQKNRIAMRKSPACGRSQRRVEV